MKERDEGRGILNVEANIFGRQAFVAIIFRSVLLESTGAIGLVVTAVPLASLGGSFDKVKLLSRDSGERATDAVAHAPNRFLCPKENVLVSHYESRISLARVGLVPRRPHVEKRLVSNNSVFAINDIDGLARFLLQG